MEHTHLMLWKCWLSALPLNQEQYSMLEVANIVGENHLPYKFIEAYIT